MRRFMTLAEAPLAGIDVYGSDLDQEGSFSRSDRAYMASAIKHNVYKEKLKGVPFDVFVYILNKAGLEEIGYSYPEGEIDWSKIGVERSEAEKQNGRLGDVHPYMHTEFDPELLQIRDAILERQKTNPGAVHFIMGDNFSDQNQMPPTPWILCHRMVHCLNLKFFNYQVGLAKTWRSAGMIKAACTMASARNGKLEDGEEGAELATQYLMTGSMPLDIDRLRDFCERKDFDPEQGVESVQTSIARYSAALKQSIANISGKTFYI